MKPGDVLLMSRPLGVGIFFAACMQNINVYESYDEIFKSLVTSQQKLVENIQSIQEKFEIQIVNAATDLTGYGFLGHLNEMIQATNANRRKENLEEIKVCLLYTSDAADDELGAEIIGGHTFESRNYSHKPYTLGVDLALSVQGVLKVGQSPVSYTHLTLPTMS